MFEEVTIGACRLICADAREVLPTLGPVDALVTDPPYGLNLGRHQAAAAQKPSPGHHYLQRTGYASYDDTEANLCAVVVPIITQALRQVRRGLVFCAGVNLWHFPRAAALGGIVIPNAAGRHCWGFNSLSHCLLYGKAPDLAKGSKPTAKPMTMRAEPSLHPCAKPLEWMLWATDLASKRGETVLDPFMGSGTTGVACVQLGRAFIGIDIERRYFDLACQRIEAAYAQGDLLAPPVAPPAHQLTLDARP